MNAPGQWSRPAERLLMQIWLSESILPEHERACVCECTYTHKHTDRHTGSYISQDAMFPRTEEADRGWKDEVEETRERMWEFKQDDRRTGRCGGRRENVREHRERRRGTVNGGTCIILPNIPLFLWRLPSLNHASWRHRVISCTCCKWAEIPVWPTPLSPCPSSSPSEAGINLLIKW